jgi:hypothetical protein
MKRTALRPRRIPVVPTDTENGAPWGDFADTFDDRVSESLVDYEDEREALQLVIPNGSVH